LLLIGAVFSWGAGDADPVEAFAPLNIGDVFPSANFHLWEINEIFTCADGSVQFVEMVTNSTGQHVLFNHELRATSGAQNRSFIFPFNMPMYTTTPKYLLIATSGFGSLPGGVIPDYILTSSLIFTNGAAGSVALIGATPGLSYVAGQLPLDGINSLSQGGTTGINSPRNFAGDTGSVSCLQAPDLTLSKTADAPGIVEAGIVMTYTIHAENQGTAAATNALITDTVPLSVTYVPNSASNGGIFGSGVISWANLTINQGATLTRTFQVTVGSTITTGDKITNTAYITSAQGASDVASVVVTGGSFTSQKIYLPLILKN
jgi:uncharacterized repeat protein (TIGR01451 family)